jgi:DNA modification methylase
MATGETDITKVRADLSGGIFFDTLIDVGDTPPDNLADISGVVSPDFSPQGIPTPSIEREKLYEKFASQILTNTALDRSLVSNQANKKLPFYSWFKYKEGFSEPFVDYVINDILCHSEPGILLDPFSGAGSALFAASVRGWQTKGIEILPVGIYAAQARFIVERVDVARFRTVVNEIIQVNFAGYYHANHELRHIRITNGAIPQTEERQLVGYIAYCQQYITDENIRTLLLYAAMCILEEISYTRKDGQFLRWDTRSGRSLGGKPFNKGRIYTFHEAIEDKLKQMVSDLGEQYVQQPLFEEKPTTHVPYKMPELYESSCLEMLPLMDSNSIDAVLTSPPYANRYDYTRTYALELVYLGCNEDKVKRLRQNMLSCTVENKDKQDQLYSFYKEIGREVDFQNIESVFYKQEALQEVLTILDGYLAQGKLNNPGIASLVRNYFYEMCFVIHELARILKSGGTIVMVNDNVRYAGEEVPVDLILSAMAESFGLTVKRIWTLGRGKGNSSQQMGSHGRTELRKCVYVWEKDPTMAQARDQLLIEAHQINYRLRSTFFYRKIKEYNVLAFPSMIANLFPTQELYSWDERTDWGIGEDAFTYISNHKELKPIQVFCHPRLLREFPALLAYYRNIAALSQKSISYLTGIDVKKYEADQDNTIILPTQVVFALTRLFNEHISLIIDSSIESFSGEELNALLLTSTGAQIDGAWRNAIGEEAEKVVQRLIIKEAVKRKLLVAFMHRIGTGMDPYDSEKFEEHLHNIGKYRGILLNNQTSILFSSEPDITIMGKNGLPWGVIEVKGGTDPAGALERYGAAKKSFENTRKDAPDAKTILIASCFTNEAKERISHDTKTIDRFFNLTEVVKEKERYNEFVNLIFSVLGEAHN